jgi:NitT/TauT family transport system substrate-binding protein
MTAVLKPFHLVLLLLAIAPMSMLHAQLEVRAGYFPNISHSLALVGKAQGAFERSLGPGFGVEWKQFNAGPWVIEAIYAGVLDLAYIGLSPTLNGYIQSHGDALRVVGGACSGGASLVVREGAGIAKASEDKGSDVQVLPLANPDQLTLFLKGKLDAAWVPEP